MSDDRHSMQGSSASSTGVLAGGVSGFLVSVLIFGVGGFAYLKKKEADVRKGWNLVPVVVAAQDIPEKTVVTFGLLSQRMIPEQFVTSSMVKPDIAGDIVNQRLLVPVQAG